jgi:hypothetical protein
MSVTKISLFEDVFTQLYSHDSLFIYINPVDMNPTSGIFHFRTGHGAQIEITGVALLFL